MGAEFSMRTDGRTDRQTGMTKLIVAFLNFANAIKIYILTLNPLTWKIWWASNNANRWQMGFNLMFKGLSTELGIVHPVEFYMQKYQ